MGWLLDYLNDLGVYGWTDIVPSKRLHFEEEVSGKLAELEQSGLAVFAGSFRSKARFPKGKPIPWQSTFLLIAGTNDPRIVRLTNCEEFINGLISQEK